MKDKKIRIGKITKPHGLKGEFKIYPYTTDISAFKDYCKIYLEGMEEEYELLYAKPNNNLLISKIAGIDSIDDLPKIIGKSIFIDYKDKRDMQEDEYLISELIGLEVYTKNEYIGKVKDVLAYSANDVFEVVKDQDTRLIPNVKQFVKKIDIQANRIDVDLIEGM